MKGTYEQNKASFERWRQKNKAKMCSHIKRYQAWRKIKFEFMAILLKEKSVFISFRKINSNSPIYVFL